jgi:hypothetical protein
MGLPLALAAVLAVAGLAPSGASAFEIAPGGFSAEMLDAEGHPDYVAGDHPDLRIDFALNLEGGSARDLVFALPPGFGVSGSAVPPCPRAVVEAGEECPVQSQVGALETVLENGARTTLPMYELETQPGEPVAIGTKPGLGLPVKTELRPEDFGITIRAADLPAESLVAGQLEIWGVPADHQEGTTIARRALLSAPTECGPLSFGFETRSREEEAPWLSATAETPPLTGCESLRFEPRLTVALTNPEVDAPTGISTELNMPAEGDAGERAPAQIRDVSLDMPPGLALSPGGAAALSACSDAQLGLGTGSAAHCPAASKIGSVEISTPAVDGPLSGTMYLGEQRPGQRLRVFMVVEAVGTTIKSVGAMNTSSANGQLSTVMRNLPPLALSRLVIRFDGGPRALLSTPLTCGPLRASARLVPYGGGDAVDTAALTDVTSGPGGSPCSAAPFSPRLSTSVSSHRAGRFTTFSSTIERRAGEQMPSRFSVTMPAGLSASLEGIESCSEADAGRGTCPAASRVGGALAIVGSPPSTATLHGSLYLSGPYRGGPFGMVVELAAKLGPFDFGTISQRGAARLSPRTGRLTMSMDRLPTTVEGVPVRLRSFQLSMNRPRFVRNPTSCAKAATDAEIEADTGATVTLQSPLIVTGCRRLGFRPSLRMALIGRRWLHAKGSPGMRVAVGLRPHDANLRAMRMVLPAALGFRTSGLTALCSHRDAIAGRCPPAARIGTAWGRTPLLGAPLHGSVYVAQPTGSGLPDIWTHMSGEGIAFDMRGRASSRNGHIAIEMAGMPDVPLAAFAMELGGGDAGTLRLGAGLCSHGRPRRLGARVALEGQNGARRETTVGIAASVRCGSGSR